MRAPLTRPFILSPMPTAVNVEGVARAENGRMFAT